MVLIKRLNRQLELRDGAVDPLRRAAKLRAPKPGKLEAELLDLGTRRDSIPRQLANDAFERIDIIRQNGRIDRHESALTVHLLLRHHDHGTESSCRVHPASCGRSVRIGVRQSMPSSSIASCAGVSAAAAPADVAGQIKRPFSSRLANRQRPWPSHHNTLMRRPCRPRNTKAWPQNGSRLSWSWTIAANPSKPLRMSVKPVANQTRGPAGAGIIGQPTRQ